MNHLELGRRVFSVRRDAHNALWRELARVQGEISRPSTESDRLNRQRMRSIRARRQVAFDLQRWLLDQ